MSMVNVERFNNLKERVKAECRRRRYVGSVFEYGGTEYDYDNQPEKYHVAEEEHFEKLAIPLNAINADKVPYVSGDRIISDNEMTVMEAAIALFETRVLNDGVRGDCKASCTGACYTACSTTCSNSCGAVCSGTCTNTCSGDCYGSCSGSCDSGCRGCGSGCASTCSGTCSGGCKTTCTMTCGYAGCVGSCMGLCYNGCVTSCGGACSTCGNTCSGISL